MRNEFRPTFQLEKSLGSGELVKTVNDNNDSGESIDDDQENLTRRAPMVNFLDIIIIIINSMFLVLHIEGTDFVIEIVSEVSKLL